MKFIAFDPGVTTGYSVGIINDGPLLVRPGQEKFDHKMLYNQLYLAEPDWIICESFEYRNRARKGLELVSLEYIGVIRLYCQQTSTVSLTMQPPSTIGGFYTDSKLKEEGVWIPGKQHAMDATRHLLHWYTFSEGYQFNAEGFKLA